MTFPDTRMASDAGRGQVGWGSSPPGEGLRRTLDAGANHPPVGNPSHPSEGAHCGSGSGEDSLRIAVDDRERNARLLAALRALPGVDIEIRRLTRGDIEVGDVLLFERKTPMDFGRSLVDGRLFAQAARLASAHRRVAWILEGVAAEWEVVPVPREALLGAMVSLALVFGLPILRSSTPEETARVVRYAARQMQPIPDRPFLHRGARPKGRRRIQLRLLQNLPGVGPERAVRLLNALGSVLAVVNASENDLCAIPGIGRTTARAIRSAVT